MADDQLGVDERKAPPATLVIFGASSDLTRRKLVPGLANLARHKCLPEEFAVVGVGRADIDDGVATVSRLPVHHSSAGCARMDGKDESGPGAAARADLQ